MSEYRDNIIKLAALNEAASSTGLEEIMSTKFAPIAWVTGRWPSPTPRSPTRNGRGRREPATAASSTGAPPPSRPATPAVRNEIVLHLIEVRG